MLCLNSGGEQLSCWHLLNYYTQNEPPEGPLAINNNIHNNNENNNKRIIILIIIIIIIIIIQEFSSGLFPSKLRKGKFARNVFCINHYPECLVCRALRRELNH